MKLQGAILLLLTIPGPAWAATWQVGPGQPLTSIQAAIDAANPGDTIEVAAGLYQENVVVSKSPLTLSGARAGDDARGRVSGLPDPATESLIAPPAGGGLGITSSAGPVTVAGFSFLSAASPATGVVSANPAALAGFVFTNNHVAATDTSTGPALSLGAGATDATICGNVFLAAASSASAVDLAATGTFHGLHFLDNDVLRDGPVAHTGLRVAGDRNLGASAARPALISGNRFAGHALGFDCGLRSLDASDITANTFTGNHGGMSGGPRNSRIHSNLWLSNTIFGLRLAGSADPLDGARDSTVEENDFQSNATTTDPSGYGDLVISPQAPGSHESNTFRGNRFASPVAVFNNDPASTVDASFNYWNSPDGPSGHAPGGGGAILGPGSVLYQPFHTDAGLTTLDFGSTPLEGNLTLHAGDAITGAALTVAPAATLDVLHGASVTVDSLTLGAGSALRVEQGAIRCGRLDLQPGAVLEIIDGDLSLDPLGTGEFHTISGTFTFFNCLDSLAIHGNTDFGGNTLGIASDLQIDQGVTLYVSGSLVLDGCSISSPGNFTMTVRPGARLEMTRCTVTGAVLNVLSHDVTVHDNHFRSSFIIVFNAGPGAAIYHNVLTNGTAHPYLLPGASVTTTVEGWGNVTNRDLVQNELALALRAPADPTRTLDAAGDLYVQPADPVALGLDIKRLNSTAQAVEALLGFSTDYLTHQSIAPSSTWPNNLHETADHSATIGRLDTTIGLDFNAPDPDGTTLDSEVADIILRANALEGRTRFFFRTKGPADLPLIDNRITTSSGGIPLFKEHPFTQNSGILTIDGTAPEFGPDATAVQIQAGSPVDVLQDGVLTRLGTLTITFDTRDQLAGIDDEDVTLELSGLPGTVSGALTGTATVETGGESFTRYTFQITIDASTPDGIFDLDATVMDRSGNTAVLPIGAIEISRFSISLDVAPEGHISNTFVRDVDFIATDATGATLADWTLPITFTGGIGAAVIEQVPAGTAFLSAKTAWHLRVRLPASFDPNGHADVSFTGPSILPGGDLNDDNIISLHDYNVLRSQFPAFATDADITGEGVVNLTDYNILRSNWLTAGDPR